MGVLGAGHVGVSMRATVAGIGVRVGRKRPDTYSTAMARPSRRDRARGCAG